MKNEKVDPFHKHIQKRFINPFLIVMSLKRRKVLQNDKEHYLGMILIDEAMRNDMSTVDWRNIFNMLFPRLMQLDGTKGLSLRSKLAIAILIVGSQNLDFFMMAFKLLFDWDVGGCFWIVQEELLRHSALFYVRNGFTRELDSSFDHKQVLQNLLEVFPAGDTPPPLFVKNKLVRLKMCELRVEVRALVHDIECSNDKWGTYVEYSSQFPLESFVSWYLSWAQDLLRRCSAETTVKLIQVSGRSVDILINGEHKCSNDRKLVTSPHQQLIELTNKGSGSDYNSLINVTSEPSSCILSDTSFEVVSTAAAPTSPLPPQEPFPTTAAVNSACGRSGKEVTEQEHNGEFKAPEGVFFTEETKPISQDALFVTAVSHASKDEEIVCSVITPTAAASILSTSRNGVFWSSIDAVSPTCFDSDKVNVSLIQGEPPSVSGAVSALVSLGFGVMGMLAPLTQYSAHTVSSESSAESQEEV